MKIKQINLNLCEEDVMDILKDENVYVIKPNYFRPNEMDMKPITKCDVADLISDNVCIIRVKV